MSGIGNYINGKLCFIGVKDLYYWEFLIKIIDKRHFYAQSDQE